MSEHADNRTWPLPFSEKPKLDFSSDFGTVRLEPVGSGEQPRLEVIGRNLARLHVHLSQAGDIVRCHVDQDCFGVRDLDFVLLLPREVQARVHADLGSIEATDLGPCELELTTNVGQIRVENVHGRLRLASDAGAISGRGLVGSLDVETDAGSIHLEIDGLDPGRHRVHTDAGSIRIALASDLDVRVEAESDVGSVRTSYPVHPAAAAVLEVSTDAGSIRVRAVEPSEPRWPSTGGEPVSDPPAATPPQPPEPPQPSEPPQPPQPPELSSVPAPPAGPTIERRPEPPAEAPSAGLEEPVRASPSDDDELERILKLVESGQLSARDAHDLLRALGA